MTLFKVLLIKDDGRCPGAFHVGCQEDVTEEPTTTTTIEQGKREVSSFITRSCLFSAETTTTDAADKCHHANNTLGTCECDKQLFIGENCSKVKLL